MITYHNKKQSPQLSGIFRSCQAHTNSNLLLNFTLTAMTTFVEKNSRNAAIVFLYQKEETMVCDISYLAHSFKITTWSDTLWISPCLCTTRVFLKEICIKVLFQTCSTPFTWVFPLTVPCIKSRFLILFRGISAENFSLVVIKFYRRHSWEQTTTGKRTTTASPLVTHLVLKILVRKIKTYGAE